MPCVVLLIGNDDKDSKLALKRASPRARHLYDVLKKTRMFSGHPVCGDPILLLDKNKEEIMEGIREAVRLVKENGAYWLAIYYAGHSFWTFGSFGDKIVIEPTANGGGMSLEKQVKQTVHKAELKRVIKTTIFVDGCLKFNKEQGRDEAEDESEDEDRLGDSKKLPRNEDFKLVCSCEFGESVRDGCLFARAIGRCARESLDQIPLIEHVQELARQLSFGRLCPLFKCPEVPDYMVLSTTQQAMGLFENTHLLRFALDLRTEDKLALDLQRENSLEPGDSVIDKIVEILRGPEGLDIDEVVKVLKSIAKEFETKQAAFEEPWCELEAIVHSGSSLEDFLKYLKHLETPVRDGSRRPTHVLIPENVRGAIVEVLQEKVRNDAHFQREGLDNIRYLVQDIGEWYKTWQPRNPPETGTCNFLLEQEVKAYSLVVKGLDVKHLQESEMERVAGQINQLCEDFGIPGRVYLVPGSLWIIFCI